MSLETSKIIRDKLVDKQDIEVHRHEAREKLLLAAENFLGSGDWRWMIGEIEIESISYSNGWKEEPVMNMKKTVALGWGNNSISSVLSAFLYALGGITPTSLADEIAHKLREDVYDPTPTKSHPLFFQSLSLQLIIFISGLQSEGWINRASRLRGIAELFKAKSLLKA